MPHLGQVAGSEAVTSGCIGQTYEVGAGASAGTSFIPHLGHVAGSEAVTSGCIGQAYEVAVASASPYSSGIWETNASTLSGSRSMSRWSA